ncbi:MAG: aromatic ring-hydroxylating dioxygenase subunit alpha [Acidimicrobiales bacterium]|jgi:nitrite reductase/ring-hydroxylating ferredoxin subunit|nr:aromatic ring-hydroxylating dioxygenase subunit alpha [Acidimicrobiales bacterium]
MAIGHPVNGLSDGDMVDTAITPSIEPVRIPRDRYVTAEFAALEAERMWPFAWQVACTVDHLPEPGDFYEYVTGTLSVLVVRGDDGTLRAFQNVCRHRGMVLCTGSGSGLDELRCPYHRWAWDLEGTLREVPSRKGFGPGFRLEDHPLFEARVDTWGPLVFVNPDPEAMPLAEYMDGMWHDADWARLDEFHCDAALRVPVRSNWKVVAEGFSDTYHVQGIHPEMLYTIDDVHSPQRLWTHCGVSYQQYGLPSPRVRDASDQEIWDNMIITQGGRIGAELGDPVPEVPDGRTLRDVMADGIRRVQAERGVDLSDFSTDQLLTLSQYNMFPNTTVLVWGDMMNLLIARPGPSPDEAFLTMFLFYRRPPRSPRTRVADMDLPEDTPLGLVPNQDVELLKHAQRGLHQPGLDHLLVGSEEVRVINLHRNLERYLGIEPTQLEPLR